MPNTEPQSLDQFVSVKEASRRLYVSEAYLRRHSVGKVEPRIPFSKIAGRIRFRVRDLEYFIDDQTE